MYVYFRCDVTKSIFISLTAHRCDPISFSLSLLKLFQLATELQRKGKIFNRRPQVKYSSTQVKAKENGK